jgi:hypothetical protein
LWVGLFRGFSKRGNLVFGFLVGKLRGKALFGQNRWENKQKCPKVEELRTKRMKKEAEMSEGRGTSDKTSEKGSRNVRRQWNFGQNQYKKK